MSTWAPWLSLVTHQSGEVTFIQASRRRQLFEKNIKFQFRGNWPRMLFVSLVKSFRPYQNKATQIHGKMNVVHKLEI